MANLTPAEAGALVAAALIGAGTSRTNADSTAAALVAAEVDGQAGHGLSRVPGYAAQVRAGKVAGHAVPRALKTRAASVRIDAGGGFAYPALDLAIDTLAALAGDSGIAAAGIHSSHHMGQAGRTVERLAARGLIALVMSNTPQAMAFHAGRKPMLGTNPLAFAAPLPGRPALLIDLSLSVVARSKIVAAEKQGQRIPPGWATDARGESTLDPTAALTGALLPAGGAKGAALALMVEVLCGALAGGQYGWEASSFLDDKGAAPAVGQMLIVFDPAAFSAAQYPARIGALLAAVAAEPDVRLPGERRLAARERARRHGLEIPEGLLRQIEALANTQGSSR